MTKIISLTGLDGTGKTTQAQNICKFITKHKYSCVVVHVGSANIISISSDKKINILAGYLGLTKDLLHIWLRYIANSSADYIIFDRYIYDSIVKISYKTGINLNLNWIEKFVPQPTLSLHLQASLSTTQKRDQEHQASYYIEKANLYIKIAKTFNLTTVDANLTTVAVFKKIRQNLVHIL